MVHGIHHLWLKIFGVTILGNTLQQKGLFNKKKKKKSVSNF